MMYETKFKLGDWVYAVIQVDSGDFVVFESEVSGIAISLTNPPTGRVVLEEYILLPRGLAEDKPVSVSKYYVFSSREEAVTRCEYENKLDLEVRIKNVEDRIRMNKDWLAEQEAHLQELLKERAQLERDAVE